MNVSLLTTGWWSPWIRLLRLFRMPWGSAPSSGKVTSMPWIRLAEPSTRRGSTESCTALGYLAQFTPGCLGQMTRSHPWARFKWRHLSRRKQSRYDKASLRAYQNKRRHHVSLWCAFLRNWSRVLHMARYRYRSSNADSDVLAACLCLCRASITSSQTSLTGGLPNPFIYLLGKMSADGGALRKQPACTPFANGTEDWPKAVPNVPSIESTSPSLTRTAGTSDSDTRIHISPLASRSGPKSGGVRCLLLFLAQIKPLLSARIQPSFPDSNTRFADPHTISGSRPFHPDSSFARTA